MTLKAKSPKVFKQVEATFAKQDEAGSEPVLVEQEKGHGRTTLRTYTLIDANQIEDDSARQFYADLRQVVRVVRYYEPTGKAAKTTTHYYVTNLSQGIDSLKKLIRSHWAIENNLHHTLDVVFGEDATVAQTNNLCGNLSLIRKFALNMLSATHGTVDLKKRRYSASLNESVRNTLLKPMMR